MSDELPVGFLPKSGFAPMLRQTKAGIVCICVIAFQLGRLDSLCFLFFCFVLCLS